MTGTTPIIQRRARGLTLVELIITVLVSTMVLAPFAVFFVQMVTVSRISSEKLLLAGDAYVAASAIRNELINASTATVVADVITYTVNVGGTPVVRTMSLVGTDLTVTDTAGTRVMMSDIAAFSVTQVEPWQLEVTLTVRSSSNQTMGVTLTVQAMLLNASVGR